MQSKSVHEEHRKRLRARFLAEGLDNFEPHNVLELLLFYAIPRRDTNVIAHHLINKFGSISAVFEADIDELASVDGIGEYSATLLKLIQQVTRYYAIDSCKPHTTYDTAEKVGDFLIAKFTGETVEKVYLLSLSSSYRLISCDLVSEGCVNASEIILRKIADTALSANASMAILAHNHPGGSVKPSGDDLSATCEVFKMLKRMNIPLLEHFVVAGDEYSTMIAGPKGTLRQNASERGDIDFCPALPEAEI